MEAGYEAHEAGRHLYAEEWLLAEVRIAEGFAADDPRRATTLDNLADVLRAQERRAEAETLYRQALDLHIARLGPQHPRVAAALENLAAFYVEEGSYAAAEPHLLRAGEILEEVRGGDDPDVATIALGLARVYHAQGLASDAERAYARALREDEDAPKLRGRRE